jgi:hypothetical protein
MPLWLEAVLKVMLLNKQKHTKYTGSAAPYALKSKKLMFMIHTLIY